MAVSIRNCLGVDIGSQWIRIAHMEMAKSGPRVLSLIEEEIKATDPSLNEGQRHQAIGKQIQDLLKAHRIRTRKAVFSVPGQTVFVRQFPLPKASPERMKRMVNFEARQRVPFPLEKTIMEFQLFESDQPNEVNVLLVAIKREFIINFMRLVRRTGLNPLGITVSSVALYNFHELNASTRDLSEAGLCKKPVRKKAEKKKTRPPKKAKKGKKGQPEEVPAEQTEDELLDGIEAGGDIEEVVAAQQGFEEIPAFVNLGASLMDLAIPKPGASRMIGFTRSVPLAGNEMDRVVRDRLQLDDINKAREIKEREAVVLASDFEFEGDPESVNMEASEAVTAIADRIISELRRSLDYYISQPDGVAVDSIVLSGGLARLGFLPNYIEEKMGVPVTLAEPRHAQLRMPDNLPESVAPFTQAIGMGLQGLGLAQNTVNFLPEEIKNIRQLQSRRWELAAMVVMLLAIIGLGFNVGGARSAAYSATINNLNNRISQYQQESQMIREIEAQHQEVAQAYEQLAQAAGNQNFWLDFLAQFIEHRPADVLITELDMRLDGNVVIQGVAPGSASVTQFVNQLRDMTAGAVDPTPENPTGSMAVRIVSMEEDARRTLGAGTQVFTIVMKTYVQLGRVRIFGQRPVEPTPTPAPATTRPQRGGAIQFGR